MRHTPPATRMARTELFGPDTPLIGDACLFQLSPTHHFQRGVVIGSTRIIPRFDVRAEDGSVYQNVAEVRLDPETEMRRNTEAEKAATAADPRITDPLHRDLIGEVLL